MTLDDARSGSRRELENYPSAKVRELVTKTARQGPFRQDRQQVFNEYREVRSRPTAMPRRAKCVSKRTVRRVMRLAASVSDVGPNLAAMVNRGAESVLFNVLAPNGEVDPRFLGIRRC